MIDELRINPAAFDYIDLDYAILKRQAIKEGGQIIILWIESAAGLFDVQENLSGAKVRIMYHMAKY